MIIGMNKGLYLMLCNNYNKQPDKKLYELWQEQLSDYSDTQIENAIKKILKEDKYMPTLARIIEMIDTTILPEWFDKDIEYERASDEEIEEIDRLLKEIKDEKINNK